MTVFTCNNDFTSMMTCIYDAWASKLGHSNVLLVLEPVTEPELFMDYIHIEPDERKAESVVTSVKKKLSHECFRLLYNVSCSEEPDKLDLIYRFLVKAFHTGPDIVNLLQDSVIIRMQKIAKRVGNEAYHSLEFMRFASVDNQVYIAHFEPKSDVIMMVAPHFCDRMPSEYWIIIDKVRNIAAVHPQNSDYYLRYLTEKEASELAEASESHDIFINLWKTYFESIAIKERENYVCQRSHFPLWMRKHVTEFN